MGLDLPLRADRPANFLEVLQRALLKRTHAVKRERESAMRQFVKWRCRNGRLTKTAQFWKRKAAILDGYWSAYKV